MGGEVSWIELFEVCGGVVLILVKAVIRKNASVSEKASYLLLGPLCKACRRLCQCVCADVF